MKSLTLATLATFVLATSVSAGDCPLSRRHARSTQAPIIHRQLHATTTYHTAAISKKHDIVDTAVDAGSFQTVVAAVKAAGLVDTLKGKGPFTVFAPSDDAFAKLPKGTVESLLKPENLDKLQSILTYHVVPGLVRADDVIKLSSAKTVNGQSASISIRNNRIYVDDAQIQQAGHRVLKRRNSRDQLGHHAEGRHR